ncbi:hypothetical protein VNO78_24646 [Psophocarpus tetragonolobus]|uniref:F-box protein n=1 Tax=Psophocarpus tetragonolobus TaxID=3891 RepID=A0AAN9S4M8_PSOTE
MAHNLKRAKSVCRKWHTCFKAYPIASRQTTSSWFLALPIRNQRPYCYVHNPVKQEWHQLSLPIPSIRPFGPIGSLILLRLTNSTTLELSLRGWWHVRGRHVLNQRGDVRHHTRQVVGSTPVEFAVWTPHENVCINETLYWVTSARAYSVMGFYVSKNRWLELGVPMAETLEFATLVPRNGTLALVSGTSAGTACIWELNEGDNWCLVDKPDAMPKALDRSFRHSFLSLRQDSDEPCVSDKEDDNKLSNYQLHGIKGPKPNDDKVDKKMVWKTKMIQRKRDTSVDEWKKVDGHIETQLLDEMLHGRVLDESNGKQESETLSYIDLASINGMETSYMSCTARKDYLYDLVTIVRG